MAVYRFKATFEDDEEIYREIEIKSSQNFEDFHSIILKSFNFDGDQDASFFISDDYWRKGEEIVLNPAKVNEKSKAKAEAEAPKRVMSKCKMASLIDDPHQKFVYIYDQQSYYTFMVELLKIVPDDDKATYPKCTKTVGIPPKNTKIPVVIPDVLEDDEDFDDAPHDDEAYVNAHCEDGIAELGGEEGEEGEEEEAEEEMEEVSDDENEFEGLADEQFEED